MKIDKIYALIRFDKKLKQDRLCKQFRWFALTYFFGLHIKSLTNLKIVGTTFGIGRQSPRWLRVCVPVMPVVRNHFYPWTIFSKKCATAYFDMLTHEQLLETRTTVQSSLYSTRCNLQEHFIKDFPVDHYKCQVDNVDNHWEDFKNVFCGLCSLVLGVHGWVQGDSSHAVLPLTCQQCSIHCENTCAAHTAN